VRVDPALGRRPHRSLPSVPLPGRAVSALPLSQSGPRMTASPHLLALAQRQMRIGNYGAAIEQLRQALAKDPTDAAAHALLAACLHATKRLYAAEYEARQALAAAPELPPAHLPPRPIHLTPPPFPHPDPPL